MSRDARGVSADTLQQANEQIFAAVLGLQPWTDALGAAAKTFRASSAMIVCAAPEIGPGSFAYSWNTREDMMRPFLDHYHKVDPFVEPGRRRMGSDRRAAAVDQLLIDPQDYVRTEFYNDFARHTGGRHICVFEDHDLAFGPPGSFVRLGFYRAANEPAFDQTELAMITELMHSVPPLMALAEKNFASLAAGRGALALLEGQSAASLILDAHYGILHITARARHLVLEAELAGLADGNVSLKPSFKKDIGWRKVGPSFPHARLIVPSPRMGPVFVELRFVPDHAHAFVGRKGARYAMKLRALEQEAPELPCQLITTHYGLRDQEALLLPFLLRGLTPIEAATRLRISEATAKRHAVTLYRKLAVRDQAGLVALLYGQFGPSW
ncbi:MAG TPA: hypothetical protein DCL54_13635 [Alphaproteobacteria bacterium]|nr:hypothetical protein [Alphaproteobacteria bacterium]